MTLETTALMLFDEEFEQGPESLEEVDMILDLEGECDNALDEFLLEELDEMKDYQTHQVSDVDYSSAERTSEDCLTSDEAAVMHSNIDSDAEIDSLCDEKQTSDEESEDHTCDEELADPRDEPIEKLENLVLSFLSQLSVSLKDESNKNTKRPEKRRIVLEIADRKKTAADGSTGTRCLKFPQKSRGASIKPFAQLFRVADLMHEALVDDIPTTKRDMYYKDVQLFKSQSVVDRFVDDLAATFELGRADLHVRASAKGLLCGAGLTMHLEEGDILTSQDSEGILIPAAEQITNFEVCDDLAWVLIVEKEAVFQTLCRLRLAGHPELPGPGLIITGKGYPDVATRQLVKTLSDNLPSSIPILALVDGDAYGIDILSVYRYGSTSMRHENESLAADRVRWLGIWASELAELGVPKDALIPITKHDEKKAYSMLRRPHLPQKWRKELQYMLHSRRKAEIEVLSSATFTADGASLVRHEREMLVDSDDEGIANFVKRYALRASQQVD